jgi:hypothetical protein
MKFSSRTLATLFLIGTATTHTANAFTVGNNRQRQRTITKSLSSSSFTKLYSSTLDKKQDLIKNDKSEKPQEQLETLENEDNENNESVLVVAVSANHVMVHGRIVESAGHSGSSSSVLTSLLRNDATTINKHLNPNPVVETSSSSSSHNQPSSSSSLLVKGGEESKSSVPINNGIKMASPDKAKTLKSKIEKHNVNDTTRPPSPSTSKTNNNSNALWNELDNDNDLMSSSSSTSSSSKGGSSIMDRMTNSGVASAAAMAAAAVNAAVAMKTLEAPDVTKSYISLDKSKEELDQDGLPLVYDKDAIEQYWKKERGALNKRWGTFVGKAVPFLTRLTTLFIKDGKIDDQYIPELSRRARIDLQDLGPTFIKAGQMMSVRPDVLPQATLEELTKLQDSVVPFSTAVAVEQIERELGGPLGQFFTSISEEPVAAASLAQVYLATLNDGMDTRVAIKVQRPDVLSTVSKDLYVLRRAAEVFQGLVERFAPQQRTNYVALLNEWSIGFYTELDFQNEARNQQRLRDALKEQNIKGITVPRVFPELCTRRILVSEWMDGVKLSQCSNEEIASLIPICQEAFLTQLFELGFFHAE